MTSAAETLMSLSLNEARYLALLDKLISVASHLQNNPAQGLIPQEDKVRWISPWLSEFSSSSGIGHRHGGTGSVHLSQGTADR